LPEIDAAAAARVRSGVAYADIPIARDVARVQSTTQPLSNHYQVQFSSNEKCEAARQQLIKDAERIGQAMIERAIAQDRQIGSGNKASLLMAAIAKPTDEQREIVRRAAGFGLPQEYQAKSAFRFALRLPTDR
jgi:hypothetical protein